MKAFQNAYLAVQPTGWMGEKTFEALRTLRIPQGLAHAGEYAFDARAVELYKQATP